MRLNVWVNLDPDAKVVPEPSSPGVGWELVGDIDNLSERDLVEQVQARLGINATRSKSTDFFLSGDREAAWVANVSEITGPFALAIDVLGDGRYIRATNPARVERFARRPPEPNPGRLTRPTLIPIRLTKNKRGLFNRQTGAP